MLTICITIIMINILFKLNRTSFSLMVNFWKTVCSRWLAHLKTSQFVALWLPHQRQYGSRLKVLPHQLIYDSPWSLSESSTEIRVCRCFGCSVLKLCFSGAKCLWRRFFAEHTQQNQRETRLADSEKGEWVLLLSTLKAYWTGGSVCVCVSFKVLSCFSETDEKCFVWEHVRRPRPSSVWPHL